MAKEISVYIHIPFCQKKCPYCHFISHDNNNHLISDYLKALSKEIQFYTNSWNFAIKTLYIGGGTPSILSIEQLEELFSAVSKHFYFRKNIEVTFEANPKTLNLNKLKFLKSQGINRLSIGAQSFDNNILKSLERIHSSDDIENTYKKARQAGFDNINLDLIFAVPGQTPEDFIKTLKYAVNLNPEHISLYNLSIEEGSQWFNNKNLKLPDNDIDFKIYQKAINFLKNNKYIQYEISNFSKKGFYCNHNLTYWKNEEYIGIGLSAHSFFNNKRYNQTENLALYLDNPVPADIINKTSNILEKNKIEESMFLNLRILNGLDTIHFKKQYKHSPGYFFHAQLEELKNLKLIKEKGRYIKLTRRGLYLANEVFEKFV